VNFPAQLLESPAQILTALGNAVQLITDPVRREAELAVAFSELSGGKVPTLIAEFIAAQRDSGTVG
jgi:hypothetical protein